MKKNSFGKGIVQNEKGNIWHGWGDGYGSGNLGDRGYGGKRGGCDGDEWGSGFGDGVRRGNGCGNENDEGYGWGDGFVQNSDGDGWELLW